MSVFLLCNNPINGLNKLEFPFTPQIDYSQDVRHESYALAHTNYQPNAYSRTENPNISLSCKFAAHTPEHFAQSNMALKFLRTYSKMNYGRNDNQRGIPPRLLRFFAYGDAIFNNVPVYIGKFNVLFPEDVDYVSGYVYPDAKQHGSDNRLTKLGTGNNTRNISKSTADIHTTNDDMQVTKVSLPSLFTVNITLVTQYNLHTTVNEFTLEKFAKGQLNSKGYI